MASLGATAGLVATLGRPAAVGVSAYLAGLALAWGSAAGGFALLRRGLARGSRAFTALLLGVFLARLALVALFGLGLLALAPVHVVTGLVSLVGFHFVFAMVEVALLSRSGPRGRLPDGEAPISG